MPRTFSRLENTRNQLDGFVRGGPLLGLSAIAQEIPRKSGNNSVASKEFSRILGRRRPLPAGPLYEKPQ